MIDKKELTNVLGLSCVEKYFLAWLNRSYDVKKLYGNSFVSISRVFDDFARGATYENYCYLPRLQDIAEEYGIVSHTYSAASPKEALELIGNQSEDELCLVRVNTRFFVNFKRASWREDHYICVGKDLGWVNEYPLTEGKFGEEEFCAVYDGGVSRYKTEDLQAEPPDEDREAIRVQNFSAPPKISLKNFESALGVLRMTRKRLAVYYGDSGAAKILREEIGLLDKLYLKARLKQLQEQKGVKAAPSTTKEEMESILGYEKAWKEALK